jgi:hypothetical protein
MDRAAFQASFEDRYPGNFAINDEEAIDECVEKLTSATKQATEASGPDLWPPISISIQEETGLKNRLRRQRQITWNSVLKAQVNCLQRSVTYRPNERRNEQRNDMLESLDSDNQLLWKMRKRMMRAPTPSPPLQVPEGPALSDS